MVLPHYYNRTKYAKHEQEHIETLQKLIHRQMLKQYREPKINFLSQIPVNFQYNNYQNS